MNLHRELDFGKLGRDAVDRYVTISDANKRAEKEKEENSYAQWRRRVSWRLAQGEGVFQECRTQWYMTNEKNSTYLLQKFGPAANEQYLKNMEAIRKEMKAQHGVLADFYMNLRAWSGLYRWALSVDESLKTGKPTWNGPFGIH